MDTKNWLSTHANTALNQRHSDKTTKYLKKQINKFDGTRNGCSILLRNCHHSLGKKITRFWVKKNGFHFLIEGIKKIWSKKKHKKGRRRKGWELKRDRIIFMDALLQQDEYDPLCSTNSPTPSLLLLIRNP